MLLNFLLQKLYLNSLRVGLHIDFIVKRILLVSSRTVFIFGAINILEYFFFLRIFKWLYALKYNRAVVYLSNIQSSYRSLTVSWFVFFNLMCLISFFF